MQRDAQIVNNYAKELHDLINGMQSEIHMLKKEKNELNRKFDELTKNNKIFNESLVESHSEIIRLSDQHKLIARSMLTINRVVDANSMSVVQHDVALAKQRNGLM